jgi:hypothetical protein
MDWLLLVHWMMTLKNVELLDVCKVEVKLVADDEFVAT